LKIQIGKYEIHVLDCGTFKLDGGAMFGVVPKTIWNKTNPADELNRITLGLRPALIIGGGRKILVDGGIGDKFDEKWSAIYGVDNKGKSLREELSKLGFTPDDISDIIVTHLHFDHCGGSVRLLPGSSSPKEAALTFPRATHWVSRVQWDWAQNTVDREPDSFFEHTFLPMKESGKLRLVDKESEIIAGITVRIFHGHTRGLMIPIISSGNETIVFAGDLIPTSVHLDPDIGMSYDLDPELVREEKKGFLAEIKSHDWKLLFQHELVSK